MKEQPNPVSGLRIPEGALNLFSRQLSAGKHEIKKQKKRTRRGEKKKEYRREGRLAISK